MTRPREHFKIFFPARKFGIMVFFSSSLWVFSWSERAHYSLFRSTIRDTSTSLEAGMHDVRNTCYFGAQYDRKMLKMVRGNMQLCNWEDMIS